MGCRLDLITKVAVSTMYIIH